MHLDLDIPDAGASQQALLTISHGEKNLQRQITTRPYHQIKRSEQAITVDANLDDWPQLSHVVRRPFIGFGKESWLGVEDGWFAFDFRIHGDTLFCAIRVMDQEVNGVGGIAPWSQDGFELRLDLRDQPRPVGEIVQNEQGVTLIAGSPNTDGIDAHIWLEGVYPKEPPSKAQPMSSDGLLK